MSNTGEGLLSFERVKEIINGIKPEDIVQYEGVAGTKDTMIGTPYQMVELKIYFTPQDVGNEDGAI